MKFTLEVEPKTVDENKVYAVQEEGELKDFPVLVIGRDSYIVEVFVLTSMMPHHGFIPYNFQIGKYSSVALKVSVVIDINHDYLAPCQGRPREVMEEQHYQRVQRRGQIIIENDCWIGMNATIMSGVTIGNGAVVAANSVVTKDVPPYAIVAGNPARIVKYRFEPDVIEKLLQMEWWNWSSEKIAANKEALTGDIDSFIEKCYEPQKRLEDVSHRRIIDENQQYLYCLDTFAQRAHLDYVVSEVCRQYSDQPYELLIYYKNVNGMLDMIEEVLSKYEQYNIYINLCENTTESNTESNIYEEEMIAQSDYFITTSYTNNMQRIGYAEKYGVEVISGFNIPMF